MKAVVVEQFGDVEKLQIKEVPSPSPEKGEVKIEVHYVSVNPVEWKITEGHLAEVFPTEFPMILGWDVSGVVVEVGEGVTSLQEGDEVYSFCRGPILHAGTFAEYCCFAAEHVVPKPKSISFAQAAAVPLVGLTAWQVLYDIVKIKKGQTCLIHAGAGGVGSMAIPLAHREGLWVATTASEKNHDYVRALGADLAIDYKSSSFVEEIQNKHPEGLDFVFDCVGGQTQADSYQLVKKGGWLVSIAQAIDKPLAAELGINARNGMVRASGEDLTKLKELIELGEIPCPPIEEMPLSDVVEALRRIKTEHTRGKIVLKVR